MPIADQRRGDYRGVVHRAGLSPPRSCPSLIMLRWYRITASFHRSPSQHHTQHHHHHLCPRYATMPSHPIPPPSTTPRPTSGSVPCWSSTRPVARALVFLFSPAHHIIPRTLPGHCRQARSSRARLLRVRWISQTSPASTMMYLKPVHAP